MANGQVYDKGYTVYQGLKISGYAGISDQIASLTLEILQYNFPGFFNEETTKLVYGFLVLVFAGLTAMMVNWLKNRGLGNGGQSIQG